MKSKINTSWKISNFTHHIYVYMTDTQLSSYIFKLFMHLLERMQDETTQTTLNVVWLFTGSYTYGNFVHQQLKSHKFPIFTWIFNLRPRHMKLTNELN